MVAAQPMFVVGIVNIRQTAKAAGQTLTDGFPAREAGTPGVRPSWSVERAVLREEVHYPVQIVVIESLDQFSQPSGWVV